MHQLSCFFFLDGVIFACVVVTLMTTCALEMVVTKTEYEPW
jgi:hypothetical protein